MENHLIEPCCVDRQLSMLLREKAGRNVTFVTSGDVTVTLLMNAISGMPGGYAQEITLCMPEIPRTLLSQLGYKISRGWASQLRLVTSEPLTADDLQSLAGRSGHTPKQLLSANEGGAAPVVLAADPALSFSFLGYRGEKGAVYVCGNMLTRNDNRTHLYVTKWRPVSNGQQKPADFVQSLIDSRIRLHKYNIEENGTDFGDNNQNQNENENEKDNEESTEEMAGQTPAEEEGETGTAAAE